MKRFILISVLLTFILVGCDSLFKQTTEPQKEQSLTLINNEEIFRFNNIEYTSQDLYDLAIYNNGLKSLLAIVDRDLLSPYEAQITSDELESITDEVIINIENGQFLPEHRQRYDLDGVTDIYNENSIRETILLELLKEAAANERAKAQIDLQQVKANYREDVCMITLQFDSTREANVYINEFNTLRGDALKDRFIEIWEQQNPDFEKDTEDSYLASQLNCDFQRYSYNQNPKTRDLIFDGIPLNDYNHQPFYDSTHMKVFYKVSIANPKETYDQTKFESELLNQVLNQIVTNNYIKETVEQKRREASLKIHDSVLNEQYNKNLTQKIPFESAPDHYTIATYNGKSVTTDDLYNYMKPKAVVLLLDKINYLALSQIEPIQLTNDELNEVSKQIN